LLVVLIIMGILATQALISFTSPESVVKGAAFNMRSAFNLARATAVNKNRNVLVDFVFDTDLDGDGDADDGYWICLDDNSSSTCDADDTNIRKTALPDEVQFYDNDLRATGGPDVTPAGAHLDVTDGVTFSFGNNWFTMQPDGTANWGGTVYLYIPDPGGATGMKAPPYAVVVSPTTGRLRLRAWKTATGVWSK